MSTILYVFLAILLLGILIGVHEFGHFFSARLCGIEVQEFALGFGPKIFSRVGRKTGTRFSLRLIPLGGYCAFYGEDDVSGTSKDDPRAYSKQPVWKRMISVLMGPGMNFILAFVVLTLFLCIRGGYVATEVEPYIVGVNAGSPAEAAGLQANDVITAVNGSNVLDGTFETLQAALRSWKSGDAPLNLTVRRGEGEQAAVLEMQATPEYSEQEGRALIGVTLSGKILSGEYQRLGLGDAVSTSFHNCVESGGAILTALKNLVTRGEGLNEVSGPVGVVSMVTEMVRQDGFDAFVNLLVLISVNLGIMNLLPIPGLDGSRFLFMLLEAVRRKPIPQEKEAVVHLAGMALLFGLMIFVTFRDVIRLFG